MSGSRRSSISIYDYPEHLNPFNDENGNVQTKMYRETKDSNHSKRKFWTFGRSRKRNSNSFSIKSTWNGLFGKRKDTSSVPDKRSTITTVSSAYKSNAFESPIPAQRYSKDQRDFEEAFGTLARRRKYTLDNSSKYSSTLTVNGDPTRIYEGSPQNTTVSILGDVTPKAPARRFGQISPRPTDEIPPLDYVSNEHKKNGDVTSHDKLERTPIPPLRRFGNRSSHRTNPHSLDAEEEISRSEDVTLRDENENIPEDYFFKRFNQDTVRRSTLSINSCMSVASVISTSGRKKRRAPQPPKHIDELNVSQVNENKPDSDGTATTTAGMDLKITEPIDIEAAIEKIDELTKKNCELENTVEPALTEPVQEKVTNDINKVVTDVALKEYNLQNLSNEHGNVQKKDELQEIENTDIITEEPTLCNSTTRIDVQKLESDNDADTLDDIDLDRKISSKPISRSNSFSVKEEIEKIEKQIKALEIENASNEFEEENGQTSNDIRQSIQANRRNFFQDMVNKNPSNDVKIEFKELPRVQKDIHVIRLTDPPIPIDAPHEPVKVIELHISEPIRQTSELLDDINPIPKPRRHHSLSLNNFESTNIYRDVVKRSINPCDKRGKSF